MNLISNELEEVYNSIPQRPPFLFIDRVVNKANNTIHCQKKLSGEEDFFQGHFPGRPIMPGVLLQEAAFQAGAMLLSTGDQKGLGVVTRVDNVKFKNFVVPGDMIDIEVELVEQLENAFYMKGKIKVENKLVLSLKFSCALV